MKSIKCVASQIAVRTLCKFRHVKAKCKHWCIKTFGSADDQANPKLLWERDTEDATMREQVEQEIHNSRRIMPELESKSAQNNPEQWQSRPSIVFMQAQAKQCSKKVAMIKKHVKQTVWKKRKDKLKEFLLLSINLELL